MVNRRFIQQFLSGLLVLASPTVTNSQVTRIISWESGGLSLNSPSAITYHPEPIIFVHGITSSRRNWEDVIQNLGVTNHWFEDYHYIQQSVSNANESTSQPSEGYSSSQPGALFVPTEELNQWKSIELPYLHTFNYGRHQYVGPGTNYPWQSTRMLRQSRQSHDPVEWNSWSGYPGVGGDYLNGRVTLQQRVEAIRLAYEIAGQPRPNVILVGHSLGGLIICDYLMTKNANLGVNDLFVPVRRAVTIDSLLWGSPIANLLVNFDNLSSAGNGGMFWASLLAPVVTSANGTIPTMFTPSQWNNAVGTWVENHNGASRYLAMDLSNAVARGNIPVPGSVGVLFTNSPFQTRLHNTPMPTTTEFITSGAKAPSINGLLKFIIGPTLLTNDLGTAFRGDGAVPLNSMAGYNGDGTPVFTNLSPVDIRGYTNGNWNTNWVADHGKSIHLFGIYPHLLDGVQYKTGSHPDNTSTNGIWSGLEKEYGASPSDGLFTHTDEPGISDLKLLYNSSGNPLLVSSLNTWTTDSGSPQRTRTNSTDFAGYQIISSGDGGTITCVGTAGTKNQSQNPVEMSGTNYWVVDGNEYLPASLSMKFNNGVVTNAVATGTNNLATATRMVTNCLVLLVSGVPQYQYGYFEGAAPHSLTTGTNNFVAAQGYNLAGLLTPQVERAFDVPVDSATVVGILTAINQGETLSNGCHGATSQTPWKQTVMEWVNVDINASTYALNFVPVTETLNVFDAWTGTAFTDFDYDPDDNSLNLNNPATAPSQLIVSNEVYLGCYQEIPTNYPSGTAFTIPALTPNALAGVPIDETFLTQIRNALNGILYKYQTNTTCIGCAGYNLQTALLAAKLTNTTWTTVVGGLIQPSHIDEIQAMLGVLTTELSCCCSNVTMTLTLASSPSTNPYPLAGGCTNVAYNSGTISANGGCSAYSFAVTSNTLPAGLTLTNIFPSSMSITGAPTTVGTNIFIITATDTNGCSTNQIYSIAINACYQSGCGDGCADTYTLSWTDQSGSNCIDNGGGTSIKVSWTIKAAGFPCTRTTDDCGVYFGGGMTGYSYACEYFTDCSDCSTTPDHTDNGNGTNGMNCAFGRLDNVHWGADVYFLPGCPYLAMAWATGVSSNGCPDGVTFSGGFSVK